MYNHLSRHCSPPPPPKPQWLSSPDVEWTAALVSHNPALPFFRTTMLVVIRWVLAMKQWNNKHTTWHKNEHTWATTAATSTQLPIQYYYNVVVVAIAAAVAAVVLLLCYYYYCCCWCCCWYLFDVAVVGTLLVRWWRRRLFVCCLSSHVTRVVMSPRCSSSHVASTSLKSRRLNVAQDKRQKIIT